MTARTVAAGAVLAVAAAAVGGVLLVRTDGAASASDAESPAFETATAERRTLTDSDTVSGTLGYADGRAVAAAAAGMVTELPAEGTTVHRGKTLYRLDDQPVTLLYGTLPLYRSLDDSVDDGADVLQLERNLEALGYDPGTVDDRFTAATEAAVEELQDALGVEVTGAVTAAQFAVLPAAVRVGAHQAGVGDPIAPGGALYAASGTTRVVNVDLDAAKSGLVVVGAKAAVEFPDGRRTRATITQIGTVATASGADQDGGGEAEASADATIPVTLRLDTAGLRAGQVVAVPR